MDPLFGLVMVAANAQGKTLTTSKMQVQNPISLWRIVAKDGTEFYTNHDEDLNVTVIDFTVTGEGGIDTVNTFVVGPVNFVASNGFTVSASRKESGLRSETRNILGVIDGIDQTRLEGGRYEMAEVTEWIVDARWPFLPWFQRNTYWITSLGYSKDQFEFSLEGMGRLLRENYGNQFSRTCRFTLGRDEFGNINKGCGQDRSAQPGGIHLQIANFTSTGAVVTHVARGPGTSARVSFNVNTNLNPSGTIPSGRPYKYGRIIWTTGSNAPLQYEIGDYTTDLAVFGSTGQFSTTEEMENAVQIGDECTIEEGCDNTFFTCNSIYGNKLNFGGWRLIPGPTRARQSPRKLW